MSSAGAAPRPAVPVSSARAEASRKNGAKSRGPTTEEGKARSSQNALKHGMRAQKYIVLPDEDAVEFAALQAALCEELAPVGALQTVLARRVAVAAWRLARADRIEAELFEERRWADGGVGLALIRDGNGTRSFETLLRYRGAAMAEFWRALRTLKALQAEQAATTPQMRALETEPAPVPMFEGAPARAGATARNAEARAKARGMPNEPDAAPMPATPARWARGPETRRYETGPRRNPDAPEPTRSLHETAARWVPKEPEARGNSGAITPRPAPNPLGPQPRERASGSLPSAPSGRASG